MPKTDQDQPEQDQPDQDHTGLHHEEIDEADVPQSAIARNLGLIKLAAVIMGIMIIVLLAVIIGTIATRLSKMAEPPAEMTITLPAGVELRSAAGNDDGMTLVVDGPEGTQIWRMSPRGEREQTITVAQD